MSESKEDHGEASTSSPYFDRLFGKAGSRSSISGGSSVAKPSLTDKEGARLYMAYEDCMEGYKGHVFGGA